MQEKFIKVTDLNINKKQCDNLDELYEDCIDIYQIQAIPDKPFISIIKVGVMVEMNDILIKKFKIYDQYTCFIVSKLYSLEQIKELQNHKIFQMIRINVCNENNKVICHLAFNFCPNTITSSFNDLEGHFSITLHYDNKYTTLEELQTYCGNENMMIKLTEWLLSDKVQSVLSHST